MIKPPEQYASPWQGWSAVYTASSILTQLYGFLLIDEVVDQMGGGRARHHFTLQQPAPAPAPSWLPPSIFHIPPQPGRYAARRPPMKTAAAARAGSQAQGRGKELLREAAEAPVCHLSLLPHHLLDLVVGSLGAEDLHRCVRVADRSLAPAARRALQRLELICYVTKVTPSDAGAMRSWLAGRQASTHSSRQAVTSRTEIHASPL
jgi:hypothetical protein